MMTSRRTVFSRRSSSAKPTPKRFGDIPFAARQKITRDQLGAIVGRVLGGSYKREKHPWQSRRAVREIMKDAGHYDTLKNKTTFNEREAVQIIKDFRAKLKERRTAQGYGLAERGDYFGARDKDVYRKFVEETYNKTTATTTAEQRRSDEEMRVRMARRRELQRQQLGIAPLTARKLASEAAPRAAERRAGLEQRLEATRQKSTPGQAAAKPPASSATPSAPPPATSHHAGGALFSSSLHLPPRHADERPASEAAPPQPIRQAPGSDRPTTGQADPANTASTEPEEPPVNIDENLPL